MSDGCNEQHHKDSCGYSVEIAKQFITLASGGVAFAVGLAISAKFEGLHLFYWVTGSFIVSIAFGLFYVMSIVAHINQSKNYNVYTPQLRFLAGIQILCFLIGIMSLSYGVLKTVENAHDAQKNENSNIEINVSGKKITHQVPKGANIQVHVAPDDDIQFQTNISK